MKKRVLSALLGIALLFSGLPAAFAASDITGHWAEKYITYLHQEGIYNPSASTGEYEPELKMTRAEFMRYINRAFHFTETAPISYSDVSPTAWYYETIQITEKYGYIKGVGNNKMDPLGYVTREQAAVIIGRLLKVDPGNTKPSDLAFSDRNQVSTWSAGYIKAAADKGILSGYSDGTFRPQTVVKRSEVAKIIYYYLGTSLSESGRAYTGADLKSDTANVTISENCSLSDAVIQGDLYLTEGLGTDSVTLTNVTVKGTIIVSGGTVTMTNTQCDNMIVASSMSRLLQVTATGATEIGQTEVRTAATLYEKGLSETGYGGFTEVTVDGDSRVALTLDAEVLELSLESEATVSMTAGAMIYELQADKAVSVTGYGTVHQANISAPNVSFASGVTVSGYTLASGISATIGGETVTQSSAAGVSPARIEVDRNDLSAIGNGVEITLPVGTKASSISCSGSTVPPSFYSVTSTGIRLQSSYFSTLSAGSYTLAITLSDGTRANVALVVTDSSSGTGQSDLTFDRYYQSSGFRDISVRVDGVSSKSDISSVILGISPLPYSFNSSTRSLVLRRGQLAQLREGVYTIAVVLKDGTEKTLLLSVSDSSPAGLKTYVTEYNTYNPTEPSFALALGNNTVRSVTAKVDGVAKSLTAGTDYAVNGSTLTLTKTGLEKFRISSGYVEFTVTLSDDSVCMIVVDYVTD